MDVRSSIQLTGHLPADTTSFVDRRSELLEAKRLLGVSRLLTLTGVGGVGKTRLALRVATAVRRAFADGVWLVDLAQLRDGTLVAHAVLQALQIHDESEREPLAVLTDVLRDRHILLVLDNCEHLTVACAELVAEVLRAAARLQVMATSREVLSAPGEYVLQVEPLPVSGRETLFAERAVAAAPSFVVTAGNQEQVAAICRRLDGLPLAIELVAARLRMMSVYQILDALEDRFDLTTSSSRVLPVRHRSLQATLDWSFQLCTPAEQLLWARASVFAGTFGLRAAQDVCADEELSAESVLTALAGLVDKSILIADTRGAEARYRFLETLHQYGRTKLRSAGESERLLGRLAAWYLDLAERGEREWFGPDEDAWLRRLQSENANLRVALEYGLSTPGQAEVGLRLATALWFYWSHSTARPEGRQWLERALARDPSPDRHRARALCAASIVADTAGDSPAAVPWSQEALELADRLGDASTLAWAAERLGTALMVRGDVERATEPLERSLAQYRALGELARPSAMLACLALAGVSELRGDVGRAVDLALECRAICQASGDRTYLTYALFILGRIEWARGNLQEAAAYGTEALRIRRSVPDPGGLVVSVALLAWIAEAAGEPRRAAVLLGVVERIAQTFGNNNLTRSATVSVGHPGCLARTRQALGDTAFEAAFRQGTELDLEQGIAFALGETPEPAAPAQAASNPLTRREREVAELVADGLSNKEIAARLVISQRTAEGHVERILTRLGFTRRAQLAVWVVQRRGRDSPES